MLLTDNISSCPRESSRHFPWTILVPILILILIMLFSTLSNNLHTHELLLIDSVRLVEHDTDLLVVVLQRGYRALELVADVEFVCIKQQQNQVCLACEPFDNLQGGKGECVSDLSWGSWVELSWVSEWVSGWVSEWVGEWVESMNNFEKVHKHVQDCVRVFYFQWRLYSFVIPSPWQSHSYDRCAASRQTTRQAYQSAWCFPTQRYLSENRQKKIKKSGAGYFTDGTLKYILDHSNDSYVRYILKCTWQHSNLERKPVPNCERPRKGLSACTASALPATRRRRGKGSENFYGKKNVDECDFKEKRPRLCLASVQSSLRSVSCVCVCVCACICSILQTDCCPVVTSAVRVCQRITWNTLAFTIKSCVQYPCTLLFVMFASFVHSFLQFFWAIYLLGVMSVHASVTNHFRNKNH